MEYKRFIHLMKEPAEPGAEIIPSLQELLKEFPYFQSAHLLLARSMNEQQHIRFERQLKLAAAYASDRKVLFSLIHGTKLSEQQIEVQEAKEPVSPFIIEEETEPINVPKEKQPAQLNDNPFNVSASLSATPPPIIVEKQEEIIILPDEQVYEPRYAEPVEMGTAASYTSHVESSENAVSTDPREVLRKRLAEILGNPEPEKTVINESNTELIEESPVLPVAEEIPVTQLENQIDSRVKEETIGEDLPSDSLLNTLSSIPEPEPEVKDSLKDLLPEQGSMPMDNIQKIELEYALEETLLSSLENLPPIEKEEMNSDDALNKEKIETTQKTAKQNLAIQPIEDRSNKSFTDWLKKLNSGGYGIVEVVHSDDTPDTINQPDPGFNATEFQTTKEDSVISFQEEDRIEPKRVTSERIIGDSEKGINPQKKELIDKFIATEPKIVPSKVEFYSPVTQAKRSLEEYDDVVSETLAKIYKSQGNILKARFCYEKLSLFYPEKRTYFAALIKEIDEEMNSSNQEDL